MSEESRQRRRSSGGGSSSLSFSDGDDLPNQRISTTQPFTRDSGTFSHGENISGIRPNPTSYNRTPAEYVEVSPRRKSDSSSNRQTAEEIQALYRAAADAPPPSRFSQPVSQCGVSFLFFNLLSAKHRILLISD